MRKFKFVIPAVLLAAAIALPSGAGAAPKKAPAKKKAPAATPAKAEVDAFAKKVCSDGKKGLSVFMDNISFEFMTRMALPEEQLASLEATYEELGEQQRRQIVGQIEENGNESLKECAVIVSKDMPCADVYKKMEGKEAGIGVPVTFDGLNKAGAGMDIKSCGYISLKSIDKRDIKEQVELIAGKTKGGWKITMFFQNKEADTK